MHPLTDQWRIAILWACLVEINEVDVDPSFAIYLFHQDHVCDPTWIGDFPNEACAQSFVHLFGYYFLSFRNKASFLLFDRPVAQFDT